MVQRVVYRRRNTYNTASNKQRIIRTPGNKLVYHHVHKTGSKVKCAETKKPLQGIHKMRAYERSRRPKCTRTVSRAYGGNRSHSVVRDKIMRAFLFEEKRCVVAVAAERSRAKKAEQSKGKKTVKKTTK